MNKKLDSKNYGDAVQAIEVRELTIKAVLKDIVYAANSGKFTFSFTETMPDYLVFALEQLDYQVEQPYVNTRVHMFGPRIWRTGRVSW